MPADAYEPALFAFGDKVFFQFLRGQVKGNVHQAAAVFFGVAAVKTTASVDNVINKLRLFAVACGNGLYAALCVNPVQGFVNHVNGKYRRRVVQRIVVRVVLVAQHRRQVRAGGFQKRLFNNYNYHSGRAEVFLRPGVDKAELFYIYRAGKDVARHIADNGDVNFWKVLPFRTVNGIVGGYVQVGGIGLNCKFLRNIAVIFICACAGFVASPKRLASAMAFLAHTPVLA